MAKTIEELVAQIKDRLDIVDVVSEQVILKKTADTTGVYVLFIRKKLRLFQLIRSLEFTNVSDAVPAGMLFLLL